MKNASLRVSKRRSRLLFLKNCLEIPILETVTHLHFIGTTRKVIATRLMKKFTTHPMKKFMVRTPTRMGLVSHFL